MGRKKINRVMMRRVSGRYVNEISQIKKKRVKNDLDSETCFDSEISEMIINAPSWPKVRRELETMPKKEDLR